MVNNITCAEITLRGHVNSSEWEAGTLTLSRQGKEYKLDTNKCFNRFDAEQNKTFILITFCEDRELYTDCSFDLTKEDLLNDFKAEIFFPTSAEISEMNLHLKQKTVTLQID